MVKLNIPLVTTTVFGLSAAVAGQQPGNSSNISSYSSLTYATSAPATFNPASLEERGKSNGGSGGSNNGGGGNNGGAQSVKPTKNTSKTLTTSKKPHSSTKEACQHPTSTVTPSVSVYTSGTESYTVTPSSPTAATETTTSEDACVATETATNQSNRLGNFVMAGYQGITGGSKKTRKKHVRGKKQSKVAR